MDIDRIRAIAAIWRGKKVKVIYRMKNNKHGKLRSIVGTITKIHSQQAISLMMQNDTLKIHATRIISIKPQNS